MKARHESKCFVKILYFAWLRERVGVGEEQRAPPVEVATVAALIAWLATQSEGHGAAFADLGLIRAAVNQDYVAFDHPIKAGDEIAFFPPVTGG